MMSQRRKQSWSLAPAEHFFKVSPVKSCFRPQLGNKRQKASGGETPHNVLFVFSSAGRSRDLHGEPRAILQEVLWLHHRHPVVASRSGGGTAEGGEAELLSRLLYLLHVVVSPRGATLQLNVRLH